MARKKRPSASFKLGDLVKLRLSGDAQGRVVELRGPLGPGGAEIYRVRIRRWPKATYIEVRADQLVLIPPDGQNGDTATPGRQATGGPAGA